MIYEMYVRKERCVRGERPVSMRGDEAVKKSIAALLLICILRLDSCYHTLYERICVCQLAYKVGVCG